jgi:pimeloyl-ACP methyl ester carboxylesterase
MRRTPVWPTRVAAATTIPRELEVVEGMVFDGWLNGIGVPVRLFAGTESPEYLRLAAEAVAQRIPGADLVPMAGQAHQAMDFDPDQFVEAVFDFSEV